MAGASYGRLVGTLLGPISKLDKGLYALIGAASLLGGTMRMTVSVCVIFLELTNHLLMLPLVMLVLLISKTVADCFNKGVYDQMVKMKGFPFMEAHAEPYMRSLVASDVVSGPLISFSGVECVKNIVQSLKSTGHNGFPVIDQPPFTAAPELCGLVLRSHLLVLLKGKRFTKERTLTGAEDVLRRFGAFDFAKAGSGKGLKLEDLDICEEEMEMFVDLHPITNRSPYTVVETMSVSKAIVLFRQLGLRHLCVVPKTPSVSVFLAFFFIITTFTHLDITLITSQNSFLLAEASYCWHSYTPRFHARSYSSPISSSKASNVNKVILKLHRSINKLIALFPLCG